MTFLNFTLSAILFFIAVMIYRNITKLKYDERQQEVHGKAFGCAFRIQICISLIYSVMDMFVHNEMFSGGIVLFFTGALGFCVFCLCCVWNDAFFPINKDSDKILIGAIVYTLICIYYGKLSILVMYWEIKEYNRATLTPMLALFILALDLFVILLNIYIKTASEVKNEKSKA